MRPRKEIVSKPKLSSILVLIIGGLLSTAFGIFIIFNGIDKQSHILIGVPFLALGLYSLYWVINYDTLHIKNGKLIFKSIFGLTKKTIILSELTAYTEIEKENAKYKTELGYMKWKDLTLIGNNFKYKISSTSYTNYEQLRKELIVGLKRDLKAENQWYTNNKTYIGIGFIAFGIILGFLFWKASSEILHEKIITPFISISFIAYGIYLLKKRKKPAGKKRQ